MTKPGEYETGRSGGENGSEDAGDLADDSGTEKAGQPFVTTGQTHRRRDVPQSEHQRTGSGDAAESTDPVQRAVQDATESQLFGNDGLQRDHDHRRDDRAGNSGVAIRHEERTCERKQRADGDNRQDQADGGKRVLRTSPQVTRGQPQFRPTHSPALGERQQDESRDGYRRDACPGGGEMRDQIGSHQHHDHNSDIHVCMHPRKTRSGRFDLHWTDLHWAAAR